MQALGLSNYMHTAIMTTRVGQLHKIEKSDAFRETAMAGPFLSEIVTHMHGCI